MKPIFLFLIVASVVLSCKEERKNKSNIPEATDLNQELADELARMAEIDQIAAFIPQGKYTQYSPEEWQSFKDSVFTTHQTRLQEMFDQYGFVGFDRAGVDGSTNFWLMVQHSDHNPAFQKAVLEKMSVEVEKGNAKGSSYGMLVDRVNVNTGLPQIYGTQLSYNTDLAQPYISNLQDSSSVNDRRKAIGLEPLEKYLNGVAEMHYEMNKERYNSIGINTPYQYPLPE